MTRPISAYTSEGKTVVVKIVIVEAVSLIVLSSGTTGIARSQMIVLQPRSTLTVGFFHAAKLT